MSQGNSVFFHNKTNTYMNSQKLWRHTQDMHWEGERDTQRVTPKPRIHLQLIPAKKEKIGSSCGVSLDISDILD